MAPTMLAASSARGRAGEQPDHEQHAARRARACRRGTSRPRAPGCRSGRSRRDSCAWSTNLPSEKVTKSTPVTTRTTVVHQPPNPSVRGREQPRANDGSGLAVLLAEELLDLGGELVGVGDRAAAGRVPAEHDAALARRLRRRRGPRARARRSVTSSLSRIAWSTCTRQRSTSWSSPWRSRCSSASWPNRSSSARVAGGLGGVAT